MLYNDIMTVIPKTKMGKWALYSFILMIVLIVMANLLMIIKPDDETTGINWPVIPGFAAGLIAAVIAIFAIIKEKERSIFIFLIPVIMILLLFMGSQQT